MTYNIYFEAAAMAFLAVLNIYIRLQYSSEVPRNRQFKQLALVMLAAVALDVITAVTIDHADAVPVWINMLLNFMYFFSDMLLEYFFVMYCMVCVYDEQKKAIVYTGRVIMLLSLIALLINFRTGWIYSFTEEDGYIHGPIYIVVHIIPIFAIIVSNTLLFIGFRKFTKNQRRAIILYTIIVISGPIVQLWRPDVLYILFTVALGFMTLTFSLETPDFQALNAAMDELRLTRDEAEEAMAFAQTANQAKSEFLSAMSHEIRTPINAILGYSEAIARETDDAGMAEYSSNISAAGKNLLLIVNEIMYFTELETDNFRLETSDFSTASFLTDIIACGEYYTEKKEGVEFRANISEKIPNVLHGDCTRLTQIFSNLMSNSAKYTEKGFVEAGVSWTFTEGATGLLSVYVKDTGIGMREEDAARISDSFLRLDKKRTQNIPGIGLGLTIVTRLLAYMDSKLEVESEYGKGTTMSFTISLTAVDTSPVGKLPERSDLNRIHENAAGFTAPSARLLAVDDNVINLELVRRGLKDTRVMIDTAANGMEALELIEKNTYDIIFLDHMMPVMDGMETLKNIKSNELCPGVPIIVVTANAVSGEKEAYLKAGFDDYVSKPFTSLGLCEILRKYLPKELIEEQPAESISAESSPKEEKIDGGILDKLSFLNTETGMAYCCNDVDFYTQIINTYAAENKSEIISKAYSENDWESYRIAVHALKGTSRTIGADYISEEARKLEFAARESNFDYINENTERFLAEYGELIGRLNDVNGISVAAN